MGFIHSPEIDLGQIFRICQRRYGPLDSRTGPWNFSETEYYNHEMGSGLLRSFISFQKLIHQPSIAEAKIFTNRIEQRFAGPEKNRTVNIDPGYITMPNICLATTKEFQHRVHVRKGIYVENTLRMRKGDLADWEWTYPDFRTKRYKEYFMTVRSLYAGQLKRRKLI